MIKLSERSVREARKKIRLLLAKNFRQVRKKDWDREDFEVREYRPGDDTRYINAELSAKHDNKYIVVVPKLTPVKPDPIYVYFDTDDHSGSALEHQFETRLFLQELMLHSRKTGIPAGGENTLGIYCFFQSIDQIPERIITVDYFLH